MKKEYANHKPCEIPWLSGVPTHWEIRRLRHLAKINNSNVNKKSYEDEREVRLCNYTDVYYNEYISDDMDLMASTASDSEIEKHTLKKDDVVITKDSEGRDDIGVPSCVAEPLNNIVCGYHLTVLGAFPSELYGRFLLRALQANGIREQFHVAANGITRYGLSLHHIKDALIPVPPIEEQHTIAAYLDRKTNEIDALIDKYTGGVKVNVDEQDSGRKGLIALLLELRSSIISEAVTGKIDVRDEVPDQEEVAA